MDYTTEVFVKNLQHLLNERNMSQTDLAKLTGLSLASINGYLLGKNRPLLTQAIIICSSLDVSLEDMCEYKKCLDSNSLLAKDSKLEKLATCYLDLNLKGRNTLLQVAESLVTNPNMSIKD